MVGLLVIGYLVISLVAARICRSRTDLQPVLHKGNCYANPYYSGYRGPDRCDEGCANNRYKSYNWPGYWLIVGGFAAWPLYAVAWFIFVERLPRPFKPDLRTRTEKLRIQNQRASSELDRIERELEMI